MPENDSSEQNNKLQFADQFEWLKTNEEFRKLCGIQANSDGTYWIEDLDLIKMQPEETKAMLRAFLKEYGSKPKISPPVRARLDALYKQIDEAKAKTPKGKHLKL